jgi:nitrite reductase/ring-hydroxylating ferredoxin subunit
MAFVTATTLAQLHDGTVLKLNVLGHQLLVFREGATISAVSARCTHLNMALPTTHKAGIVTCHFHGAQFNLTTGSCVWGSRKVKTKSIHRSNPSLLARL